VLIEEESEMTKYGWIALTLIAIVALMGASKRANAATIGTNADISRMSAPLFTEQPIEELGTPYLEILGQPSDSIDDHAASTFTLPSSTTPAPTGVQRDIILVPSKYSNQMSASA
jgi:hypothetical protein